MKRRVLMLALFLVLGAIINVAVAWGCALRSDKIRGGQDVSPEHAREFWRLHSPPEFPSTYSEKEDTVLATVVHRIGMTWQYVSVDDFIDWEVESQRYSVGRAEFGLPMRSMYGILETTGSLGNKNRRFRLYVDSPIHSTTHRLDGGKLPIGIDIPGFAINTVFYAAVLWLLFAAPFALRKRRRIKRGLSPKCAYPVGTSDKCTECGAALPSPSR